MPSVSFIMQRCIIAAICSSIFFGNSSQSAASEYAPQTFSIGLGVEYAGGTFGTATHTDFVSIPLILTYKPTHRFDFELVIPYIYQSNSSSVYGAYMPSRSQGSGVTTTMAGGMISGARARRWGSAPSQQQETVTYSDSQNGIGDLTLTAGYVLINESYLMPQLRTTAYIKFPTADRDMGLGTGEFDAGPGIGLDKWLGNWNLFAEGWYIFQGDSDLYATKDYLSYSTGIGYQITNDLYMALAGKGATAPGQDAPDSFEGRVKLNWRLTDTTGLEGYLSKGFTNGSPDYGGSLALFRYF